MPELSSNSDALNLLLDMDLSVSVCLGRTVLPLADILKLAAGSLVELDRTADDLVELIANDRVIATGAIVMVDSCYAIKIHQVASRSERVQTTDLHRATAPLDNDRFGLEPEEHNS